MQLNFFDEKPVWETPRLVDLPDLKDAKLMGIDTETRDPKLKTDGPGFLRGDAYVVGFSVAVDGFKTYIPLRHYDGNMEDIDQAIRWIKHTVSGPGRKLAANFHYDADALYSEGITINGDWEDVQTTDSLINTNASSFSLEAIAQRRGLGGKDDKLLSSMLHDRKSTMSDMHKLLASEAASYAIRDADLLLDVNRSQQPDICKYELGRAADRESKVTKILWKMHQRGIRIDVEAAQKYDQELHKRAQEHLNEAYRDVTIKFNPDSSKSLAKLLEHRGFGIPVTAKGNPSIGNEYLASTEDKVLVNVYQYRRLNKIRRDFIHGLFLRYEINGRIHPQWFQSKHTNKNETDGKGGADTGRVTGSKPNLTQIPARDPELGPMCRSIVLAEEGEIYCKCDYGSQEPRWVLHFACKLKLPGAAETRQMFIDDKAVDFHKITRDMVETNSGVSIIRRDAKTINLGLTYGMGMPLLAAKLGLSQEAAAQLFKIYHAAVPFIGQTAEAAMKQADELGYIRTWGGRIRQFDEWESKSWGTNALYKSRAECMSAEGSAKRAKTHKALNSSVQGTGADQLKQSMIHLDSEGILPLLQCYDELGFSIPDIPFSSKIVEIMEHALPGEVPALVEPDFGPNWGNLK